MPNREARDFLPLHPLDLRILLSLLNGANYGTRIVEEVEAREGGRSRIYPANLFRRIRDLLGKGLIEEAEAPQGADPRRTYVCLTQLGRAVASAEAGRLRELVAEVDRVAFSRGG